MLIRWASFITRRRKVVLAAVLLLAVTGAVWGTGVFSRLGAGGFEDPGSQSAHADAAISATFGGRNPDVIAVYSSPTAVAGSAGFRDAVTGVERRLRAVPGVASVVSGYDGAPGLVSRDRHATYLIIRLAALDDSAKRAAYTALRPLLAAPGLTTAISGSVAVEDRVDAITKSDVTRGEMLAMPLLLLLLIIIFGGVVAASMPLLVGILAILGAFTVTRLITLVTDVSTFAANTITLLGLGMAIDYSLLIISRYRDELRSGLGTEQALGRAVATAGRTVLVSGLLVAASLASLLIFPEVFLRSMAFGGIAAVGVAMITALTALPAALAVLGPRINALRVRPPRRLAGRRGTGGAGTGWWGRLAGSVMSRPVRYVAAVLAVLTVLALPLAHLATGSVDERVLPTGDPVRTAAGQVAGEFPGNAQSPIFVLVTGTTPAELTAVRDQVARVPDVTAASVSGAAGAEGLITVSYPGTFAGAQASDAVRGIRALRPPPGVRLQVGGDPADIRDEIGSLASRLPWMLAIMALVTIGVLLIAFGSVLLPVKAVVTNVGSIAATFGALVWVFQDGHLAGPLGFTATGTLEPTVLILILAVLFGLATDYEVFLLSRVREAWDATGDNRRSVAEGMQRTGRIITAAALLLVVVTGAFATGDIVVTKMIGIGMALGIALDATAVRALLVPATMRLLGRWNWWAPPPVARLHRRVNLEGRPPSPVYVSEGANS